MLSRKQYQLIIYASERRMRSIASDKKLSIVQVRKELADLNNQLQSLYRLAEVPFAFM